MSNPPASSPAFRRPRPLGVGALAAAALTATVLAAAATDDRSTASARHSGAFDFGAPGHYEAGMKGVVAIL